MDSSTITKHYLIVMVCPWWNAEAHYAFNLANTLKKKNNHVTILSKTSNPFYKRAKQAGFKSLEKVELDTINPIKILLNYIQCKKYITKQKVDIVVTFKSKGAFIFPILRMKKILPYYIKIRSNPIFPKNNTINRFLYSYKSCDILISVNKQIKQWFIEHWKMNQNIPVLYFGTKELTITNDRESVRKYYNIQEKDILLTLVGRIDEIKGHTFLLRSVIKYLNKEKSSQLKIIFAVKDPDEFPEKLKKVENLIEKENLNRLVQVHGWVESLGNLMQASDYLIIPSLGSEAICRVAVESFSVGTPVIANPVGTLKEIIRHKKNGYVCESIHEEEMIQALTWAEQNHNNISLRDQAKKSFLDSYSILKLGEDFYHILREHNIL